MEAIIPIPFCITTIELLGSSLNIPDKPLPANSVFQFDIHIEHQVSDRSVAVVSDIYIYGSTQNDKLGSVCTRCVYELPQEAMFGKDAKDKKTAREHLLAMLNSVSLSTTRGMMFSLFKGTFLHNAVLPIIGSKNIERI